MIKNKNSILDSINFNDNEIKNLMSKYSVEDQVSFNARVSAMIQAYSDFKSLNDNKLLCESRISGTQNEINSIKELNDSENKLLKELEKYNQLFDIHAQGSIPLAVLNKLVKYLNNDRVKFEPVKKDDEFNIDAFINVKGNWISYNEASDGQKCYLDIFILIRITEFLDGIGLLVMDEPISNMDPEYVKDACDLIPEINAETILISSHTKLEGYDHLISVEQDDRGITNVKF